MNGPLRAPLLLVVAAALAGCLGRGDGLQITGGLHRSARDTSLVPEADVPRPTDDLPAPPDTPPASDAAASVDVPHGPDAETARDTGPDTGPDGGPPPARACDECHGKDGDPAPPPDTLGNRSGTARGVGTHRSHLAEARWHATITCAECHIVPAVWTAAGHADTALPAEVTFGARATASGALPTWDGTRCASTYCHGGTLLPGGTLTAPAWTDTSGSQDACGTCHGLPPGGTHPASDACEDCHGEVVRSGRSFSDGTKHIDGVVQVDE